MFFIHKPSFVQNSLAFLLCSTCWSTMSSLVCFFFSVASLHTPLTHCWQRALYLTTIGGVQVTSPLRHVGWHSVTKDFACLQCKYHPTWRKSLFNFLWIPWDWLQITYNKEKISSCWDQFLVQKLQKNLLLCSFYRVFLI